MSFCIGQNYYPNNNYSDNNCSFRLLKRIKLIHQVAESHADDGDEDACDGGPPMEHLDEEFQSGIVQENVARCYEQVPDNLRPAAQGGI